MLKEYTQLSLSEYEGIYDRIIPPNHFLRQFNALVDLSFIYEELKKNYSWDTGRHAISPILLFKYLLLKVIYPLSDADLVERSRYDMSFKYFLGLRPEDEVIHASTLTKFRKLRLKDENLLDLLLGKSVEIAREQGVIKSKQIIVDATHTKAKYNRKSAYEILLSHAKQLRKEVYRYADSDQKNRLPKKVENGLLDDALSYCTQLIETLEADEALCSMPSILEKLNLLREITEDSAEHLAEARDKDARVGHKTADTSFFGYKTHIAMTDERIIAAATVTSGEKSDGAELAALVEKSRKTGLTVKSVIGDTAYSGKKNLALAASEEEPAKGFELIAKLNPVLSDSSREEGVDGFSYNKDAQMFVCPAGHIAIRKVNQAKRGAERNRVLTYHFDIGKCRQCPRADGCYQPGAKSRTYSVSIKSNLHQKQRAFQETEVFRKLAAQRYKIEAKNSELKNRHGYDVASYAGLFGMEVQGATTMFVVNIKRIIKLMGR